MLAFANLIKLDKNIRHIKNNNSTFRTVPLARSFTYTNNFYSDY